MLSRWTEISTFMDSFFFHGLAFSCNLFIQFDCVINRYVGIMWDSLRWFNEGGQQPLYIVWNQFLLLMVSSGYHPMLFCLFCFLFVSRWIVVYVVTAIYVLSFAVVDSGDSFFKTKRHWYAFLNIVYFHGSLHRGEAGCWWYSLCLLNLSFIGVL